MTRFLYFTPILFLMGCAGLAERVQGIQQTVTEDVIPTVAEHAGEIATQIPGAASGNPVSIIALVVAGITLAGAVATKIITKKKAAK